MSAVARREPYGTAANLARISEAVSATVVLFRTLIKKGLLTRDEVMRVVLDEAVSRAIQAEAQDGREAGSDANRKCAEILKLIAEKL